MNGIHTNGLPFIDDGSGHRRVLACLPPMPGVRAMAERWPVESVIPRSQWADFSLRHMGAKILDQDGHGSCVGHGSCTAFTVSWLAAGQTPHDFSACYIYGLINGGRDNGAIVSDALEVCKAGVCLESTVPENMIYERQFPSAAKTEAQRFRADKFVALHSFDEMGSAILAGNAVSFGVALAGNFDNVSSDGVVPSPRGGAIGGHCMAGIGLKQINGRWYIEVQNSWGTRWGASGYCWMPEECFQAEDPDAWAVVCAKDDPQDPNLPPVLVT